MITISPELEAQINQCAQHAGYQPDAFIKYLVTEYVEEIQLASSIMQEEGGITLQDLRAKYEL